MENLKKIKEAKEEAIKNIKNSKAMIVATDKGMIIGGHGYEILACLGCIACKLNEVIPKETIEEAMRIGFKQSNKENKKNVNKFEKEQLEELSEIFKEISKLF